MNGKLLALLGALSVLQGVRAIAWVGPEVQRGFPSQIDWTINDNNLPFVDPEDNSSEEVDDVEVFAPGIKANSSASFGTQEEFQRLTDPDEARELWLQGEEDLNSSKEDSSSEEKEGGISMTDMDRFIKCKMPKYDADKVLDYVSGMCDKLEALFEAQDIDSLEDGALAQKADYLAKVFLRGLAEVTGYRMHGRKRWTQDKPHAVSEVNWEWKGPGGMEGKGYGRYEHHHPKNCSHNKGQRGHYMKGDTTIETNDHKGRHSGKGFVPGMGNVINGMQQMTHHVMSQAGPRALETAKDIADMAVSRWGQKGSEDSHFHGKKKCHGHHGSHHGGRRGEKGSRGHGFGHHSSSSSSFSSQDVMVDGPVVAEPQSQSPWGFGQHLGKLKNLLNMFGAKSKRR